MNWPDIISRDKKSLLVLLDPDKNYSDDEWLERFYLIARHSPDGILLGGSRLDENHSERIISIARSITHLPIIAFPGDFSHVSNNMDGVLFLSLISGRNPEYLINQHVKYGMKLRAQNLAVLPTGYMLVDGGHSSSVSQVTRTQPIPAHDIALAVSTAVAGEMLGLKAIYLEAGSGAIQHVSPVMTRELKSQISIPLIVGGGIRNRAAAAALYEAGADVLVVGNGFEADPALLAQLCEVRNTA
jgi:phosphoglycerol geranylgeranyltransferase